VKVSDLNTVKSNANRIVDAVQKAFDDTMETTGVAKKSKRIKTELCTLGQTSGYYVCCNQVDEADKDWGEWLFDVVWLKYKKRPEILGSVAVAVESELHNEGDIRDDFQKLLQSRAHLRVMIFQDQELTASVTIEDMMNRLKGYISEYEDGIKDDCYLLIGYDNKCSTADKAKLKVNTVGFEL